MVINLEKIESWKTCALKEIVEELGTYPDDIINWEIRIESEIQYSSYQQQDGYIETKYYFCMSYEVDGKERYHSIIADTE